MGVLKFVGDKIKGKVKEKLNDVHIENIISYENTRAAFNLIKLKTENRILIISSLASIIFLGFYAYLIYLNVNPYSIRHIIIYSILAILLFITFIINIVLNPSRQNKMSTDEKNKAKRIKNIWKNINLLIATLTKLVSLGFMLYEIITIDSSAKRLIPFGLSTVALLLQLAITYISRLIVSYYEILLVGLNADINSSGIVQALTDNQVIDPIRVSGNVNASSADKISQRIADQVDNNKKVKEKDFKDLLYKAASYLKNNPITTYSVMSRFDIGFLKANKILNELEKLGIISRNSRGGKMLIEDQQEIKNIIYSNK